MLHFTTTPTTPASMTTDATTLEATARRRAHAAEIALRLLRQKRERCQPQHAADIDRQIAAIITANPTLK